MIFKPIYNVPTFSDHPNYIRYYNAEKTLKSSVRSIITGTKQIITDEYYLKGVLSADGHCKSFDEAANGYARSEAISLVFLQKAKDAKRVYATFIHGKTNCDGFKEQGITFPSSIMQGKLLENFYKEVGLSPSVLDYIEAHATGTKVGDPEEVNALDKALCTGRKEPLWIGSIKSNLGHTESASGVSSVAKVCARYKK